MSLLNLFDQAFSLRLTVALLHFLWQGALIAVTAAMATWLLRRASANARYTVHVAALALMPACVAVTFGRVAIDSPASTVDSSGEAPSAAVAHNSQSDGLTIAPNHSAESPDVVPVPSSTGDRRPMPSSEADDAVRATAPVDAGAALVAPSRDGLLLRSAPYVTVVYLAGVLLLLIRLVRGAWDCRRLRRAATEIADAELVAWLRAEAERSGLGIVPALRWCAEISVPVVIGVLRPVILLPAAAATGLSMDQLQAVIAHELAHVRRYDLVVNLLQRVIETLLFFHPAVWWISRQVSREREEACDERVLSVGFKPMQYADALVRMAEISCAHRDGRHTAPVTALAADGAAPTEFKRRIHKVLGVRESSQMRPGRWALLAVTVALLAVLLPVWAHFSPTATAENAPPAEDIDETMDFLRKLRPDSKVEDPVASGRRLADDDLADGTARILYYGEPWSAGKPLVDDQTGYPVEIVAGCIVTRDFIQLVDAYNTKVRAHFRANPDEVFAGRETPLLRVLNADGSPARIQDVQYVQRGFPLIPLPDWFGEPRGDGLVSLAELPEDTDWLAVGGTVFVSRQPDEPQVIERRLLPPSGLYPRNDNLWVEVSVVQGEAGTETLRIAIENHTGADVGVSPGDIRLETGMPVAEPLWGLSPDWASDAVDRFPVTTIHDGQTGHLDIDWRRWIREGLWYQRRGPHVELGPALTNPPSDGISVRAWVWTHGSIPVEVIHPRILAAEHPWPGAGVDTPEFKQRAARVAADHKRLEGAWRLTSFFVKGSADDVRGFPLPGGTDREGGPRQELTDSRLVIARATASGVPHVVGRFSGQPAPDGPILQTREGTWLLNESYDPPTFDVTIPGDESSGTEEVRRQFLYRFTGDGDDVTKLELGCNLVDPEWAPAGWTQTPLLVYTFEPESASD